MRSNGIFALTLMASSVLGAAVPKVMTEVEAREHEEYAELEARGFHASCILAMATCLGGYGLANFKYQQTMIEDVYMHPWDLCTVAAVLSGNCHDSNGAVKSEPAQMFEWHREHGLTRHTQCSEIDCTPGSLSECENLGCGRCFTPPPPQGPMPPPPAPPRCAE